MYRSSAFLRILSLNLLLILTLAACGGNNTGGTSSGTPSGGSSGTSGGGTTGGTTGNIKVGLVTDIGGLDDHSFNSLANQGLKKAASDLGVETQVIESKSQSEYVPNLTQFANKKFNLVIAVGFLMSDAVAQVSQQFPDTKFAIIDAVPQKDKKDLNASNLAPLLFKEQEAGYLAGYLAGLIEKQGKLPRLQHKNTIAAMGGIPIPPVDHYIAGYQKGAKDADPDIKVLVDYSGSFTDQGKGKEIGLVQIGKGADILFQVAGASGLGYLTAADEKNVYGIGVDADQGYLHPNSIITSALKRVDVSVYSIIKELKDGKFTPGIHSFDLKIDGVGVAPFNSAVPAEFKQPLDSVKQKILSGSIVPPDTVQK